MRCRVTDMGQTYAVERGIFQEIIKTETKKADFEAKVTFVPKILVRVTFELLGIASTNNYSTNFASYVQEASLAMQSAIDRT